MAITREHRERLLLIRSIKNSARGKIQTMTALGKHQDRLMHIQLEGGKRVNPFHKLTIADFFAQFHSFAVGSTDRSRGATLDPVEL